MAYDAKHMDRLTWSSILLEVIFRCPVAWLVIEAFLHDVPGEHDRRIRRINVLSWVPGVLIVLDKVYREVSEVGKVEAVEPDHWA